MGEPARAMPKAEAGAKAPAENVVGFGRNAVRESPSGQEMRSGMERGSAASQSRPGARPAVEPSAGVSMAERLLATEAQLRKLTSRRELRYFAANEFRALVQCEQILLHEPGRNQPAGKITTVSGLAAPDPNAPLLIWLQNELAVNMGTPAEQERNGDTAREAQARSAARQFRLATNNAPGGSFGLPCVVCVPLFTRSGKKQGAISFLTRRTLDPGHIAVAQRLAEAYGHAEQQFLPRGSAWLSGRRRPFALAGILLFALAMMIPVPLTVLAPVTVSAFRPEVVTAPLTGVIEKIHVSPNAEVEPGTLLFSFNPTEWQNQVDLAEKRITIAEAHFKRANQDAFNAGEGRRELAVAKAELTLAIAEKTAAARRLSMVDVRAERAGLVLFESEEKWKGRPVSTGERVMRIADPSLTRFAIDLAVDDSIILSDDARVKIFLDADPLHPIEAQLTRTSYVAEMSERDQLVFPLEAKAQDGAVSNHRIGLKGTAQVYGNKVPMWFYLFRKPVSFLRQYFGL